MGRWTDGWIGEQMYINRWVDREVGGWVNIRMDEWVDADGWMGRCIGGWMDGRIDLFLSHSLFFLVPQG